MISVQRTERYFSSMARCYRGAIDTNGKHLRQDNTWKEKKHQIQMQRICNSNISPLKKYNSFLMTQLNELWFSTCWVSWKSYSALTSELNCQRALLHTVGAFENRNSGLQRHLGGEQNVFNELQKLNRQNQSQSHQTWIRTWTQGTWDLVEPVENLEISPVHFKRRMK